MHEFSLAEALVTLTAERVEPDQVVRSVRVRAGAMRAIDPGAMEWAWLAAAAERYPSAALRLDLLPWEMRCSACGEEWKSEDPALPCGCGSDRVYPIGGDELTLVSIEVDDPITVKGESHADPRG